MKTMKKLLTLLTLAAMLTVPTFAQTVPAECAPVSRAIASDADVITIVETANAVARQLPSRAFVATIEDEADRLFLTKVLDHVATAQRADQLTATEREAFADELRASAAALQVGISPCSVAVAQAVGEKSTAVAADGDCSCVQQCYREWKGNMADCDGSYWCEVGVTLLFELCLASCLIPG